MTRSEVQIPDRPPLKNTKFNNEIISTNGGEAGSFDGVINSFDQAVKFLYGIIPQGFSQKNTLDYGMKRLAIALELLGNPHKKLKVIHIAGTSGKGSTATIISSLLSASGFKVGLSVSPHLVDIRERMQVDNRLLSEEQFCDFLNEILPVIDEVKKGEWGVLTYFEVNLILAVKVFADLKVDYAVIETGLGGLWDGTNIFREKNKLCVLTRIGLDHIELLGDTLEKIAFQKAGIMHEGNSVIALRQNAEVNRVFSGYAEKVGANIVWVDFEAEQAKEFNFQYKGLVWKNLALGVKGAFQRENCTLALNVLFFLAERDDFVVNEVEVREALLKLSFLGKFQEIKFVNSKGGNGLMIVDGAHNPQKMRAFMDTLNELYPNEKLTMVVAFKKGKDYREMLKMISSKAKTIILSNFFTDSQDLFYKSEEASVLKSILTDEGCLSDIITEPNIGTALELAMSQDNLVIVTGSLYLSGEVIKYMQVRVDRG